MGIKRIQNNKNRFRTLVVMTMVCVMVLTACGKEDYNTEGLRDVNVLNDQDDVKGGGVREEGQSHSETGDTIHMEGGSEVAGATAGDALLDEGMEGGSGIAEIILNNMEGGTSMQENSETGGEGGEETEYCDMAAQNYELTLEEAMAMTETLDMTTADNDQWLNLDEAYDEYGDTSSNETVNYEEVDITPSQELEQEFDDIVEGGSEEIQENTVSAGNIGFE